MTALDLLRLFDSVFLVALSAWVGTLLVWTFAARPLIARVLPAKESEEFGRALAGRLFVWGAISGAVALPALVCGPLAVHELRSPIVAVKACLIIAGILVMFYCANVLVPALADRSTDPERAEALGLRLANLSSMVIVAGIGLLIAQAHRPTPTSPGIVEPTPEQRAADYQRHMLQAKQHNESFWLRYGQRRGETTVAEPSSEARGAAVAPTTAATHAEAAPAGSR